MPLLDRNLKSTWDELYETRDGLHFERAAMPEYYGEDVENLIRTLETKGLQKGQRIALIGAGFGYTAERWVAAGYGPMADGTLAGRVIPVDTSTWIQSAKGAQANTGIYNFDVNASTGRRALRLALGANNVTVDWSISEDVLPLLTDNECGPFASAMRQLSTNVVHVVSTAGVWATPGLNSKTLAQWKALMTPDFVVDRHGLDIL